MLRIGLTGGIGSGKSTVAAIFETLGIPVYYADTAARRMMNEDAALKAQIIEHFGEGLYTDGKLNREQMAALVFNQPAQLSLLNSLVHPATIADAEKWMATRHSPYAIKEAALIFESGSEKQLDYVIGVKAPEDIRMQRAMQRDGISKEQVQARMDKQMNEQEKLNRCDFIIHNDEQSLLIPQVVSLHQQLTAMCTR